MKKFMILCMSLFLAKIYAQQLDQKLSNVDQSSVTSGIIYERSGMYTAIFDFNKSNGPNMASTPFFEQTLNDLYFGSNQLKFKSNEAFKQITDADKYKTNVINMGIINTDLHVLNYNPENPSAGGLTYNETTKKFAQISGRPPFLPIDLTMVAPLKKETTGSSITFSFKSNLVFSNGSKTIKSLYADFGDGTSRMVTGDGLFKPISFTVNYTSSGEKKLKFDIVYWDNTTLTTYGSFYLKYINNSTKAVKGTTVLCNGETMADDFSLVADTPFQGYNEPFAFKAKIDYRIFYHTNNGNTEKKLLKPIIIIDGFDPGDKRKILACDYVNYNSEVDHSVQDMMMYPIKEDGVTKYKDLIKELREKGYDVTIVNQPTYCVSNVSPYNIVACGTANSREVNGGADFIERNAMALSTLIKSFNAQLKTNESKEKLAIVGPSMGGQISRYALASLEKQGIDHNTRLWISVDSPHLGANIPLGDQALIHLLKEEGRNVDAGMMYDNLLGAPAARQQLIEFHRDPLAVGYNYDYDVNINNINGRTISQGYSTNAGNPFFQQYYNNLFTNGLPNSNGFPMNLRKIALTNGSLTGKTQGTNSQLALNIRAFKKVQIKLPFGTSWTFTVHLGSLESYFMPAYNTGFKKLSYFKKGLDDHYAYVPNINSRGNMDTVPGGWYPAQNDIARAVLGKSVVDGVRGSFWQFTADNLGYFSANQFFNNNGESPSYFELREFEPNHSFISTFSSLALRNPDRNWSENLQRNLVCTGETPFDSYYGSSENTQHTSFTEESVKWLMEELAGKEQAPWFPIKADAMQGADKLCLNQTSTYSLPNDCALPSKATWTVSSNLQIVGFTDYTVNVKALYQGQATITATFQNGQTVTKNVHIGGPNVKIPNAACGNPYDTVCFNYGNYPYNQTFQQVIQGVGMEANQSLYSDYEWEMVTGNSTFVNSTPGSNGRKFTGNLATIFAREVSIQVRGRAKNNCGWGPWKYIFFNNSGGKTDNENTDFFTISPNPANDFINIALVNQNNAPASKNDIQAELYNSLGSKQKTVKLNNSKGTISVSGLLQGVYTLKIMYDDKIESHQVIIK